MTRLARLLGCPLLDRYAFGMTKDQAIHDIKEASTTFAGAFLALGLIALDVVAGAAETAYAKGKDAYVSLHS